MLGHREAQHRGKYRHQLRRGHGTELKQILLNENTSAKNQIVFLGLQHSSHVRRGLARLSYCEYGDFSVSFLDFHWKAFGEKILSKTLASHPSNATYPPLLCQLTLLISPASRHRALQTHSVITSYGTDVAYSLCTKRALPTLIYLSIHHIRKHINIKHLGIDRLARLLRQQRRIAVLTSQDRRKGMWM
jgi:hypothetical protein